MLPRLVPPLAHVSGPSRTLQQRNPAKLGEGAQSVREGGKEKREAGDRGRKALS